MFTQWLLRGFAIVAALFAIAAHAEDDSGLYLGVGIGEATNESGEFKGSDTAFKIFGGYAFNPYLSGRAGLCGSGTQEDSIDDVEIAAWILLALALAGEAHAAARDETLIVEDMRCRGNTLTRDHSPSLHAHISFALCALRTSSMNSAR